MPITFANPALLFGAAAAALPVIIHFLSRRKIRRVEFSDLRFLSEARIQQSRSLGIRRWLLLLLRVLAILCVALALAQPQWGGLAPTAGGGRSVLFLIDVSASMQTQEGVGTRLSAARDLCVGMIRSLPRGSTVQVVAMGAAAQPLFADWLPAGGVREPELAALTATDGSSDLAGGLRAVAEQLAVAPRLPAEIVLLGDLQGESAGGSEVDDQQLATAVDRLLAAGESRLLIRRVGESVANGGVLAVGLPQRAVHAGESVSITAAVRLEHDEEVFRLEIDGRQIAEAVAVGQGGTTSEVRFPLTVPDAGLHRGRVVKESDKLPVDDDRPFVLQVHDRLSVLLVHGADRDASSRGDRVSSERRPNLEQSEVSGRGGWRYLAEALAPGDAPALFSVRSIVSGEMAAGDLARADVVFFVDPDPLGRQLFGGLLGWLAQGGAAAFFLGDPTLEAYLAQTLLPGLELPAELRFRSRSHAGREKAVLAAPQHPIFQGFDDDALATLGDVDWRRYFAVAENDAQVLLASTSQAPLLLEGRHGQGTFLLLPFNLRLSASNLALSPMSLPLCQRLATYLASRSAGGGAGHITVGQRPAVLLGGNRIDADGLADAADLRISATEIGLPAEPAELDWPGGLPQLRGELAWSAGFYTFTSGPDTVGVVAAVTPPGESDPNLGRVDDLRDRLAAAGLDATGDLGTGSAETFVAALTGRDLSPWLLVCALLLLCAELRLGRGGRRA